LFDELVSTSPLTKRQRVGAADQTTTVCATAGMKTAPTI